MGRFEALEGLQHAGRPIPKQLRQKALQALLVRGQQLRLSRWDPEHHRRAVLGEPGRSIREGRLGHQAPDDADLLQPPLRVGEGPAPDRVGVEGPRQGFGRGGELNGARHPRLDGRGAMAVLCHD